MTLIFYMTNQIVILKKMEIRILFVLVVEKISAKSVVFGSDLIILQIINLRKGAVCFV